MTESNTLLFHIWEIKKAAEKLVKVIGKTKLQKAENLAAKWGGLILEHDLKTILGSENFYLIRCVMASNVYLYGAYYMSLLKKAEKENPGILEKIKSSAKQVQVREVLKMLHTCNCKPPHIALHARITKEEGLSLLETTDKKTDGEPSVQHLFSIKEVEGIARKYSPYSIFDGKAMKEARRLAKGYGYILLYDAVLLFGGQVTTLLLNELQPVEGDPHQMEVLKKMEPFAKKTEMIIFVDKGDVGGLRDMIVTLLMPSISGSSDKSRVPCLSLILAEEEKKNKNAKGEEAKAQGESKGARCCTIPPGAGCTV